MNFLHSLYVWMAALSGHPFYNMLEFLDCCNFRWLRCISCILGCPLSILILSKIKQEVTIILVM